MPALRLVFNADPANYDQARPTYPARLFADISEYAQLSPGSRLLEIGCGTGQATVPFLEMGHNVTAVEIGGDLAAFTRQKLSVFSNLVVAHEAFEDFQSAPASYDLVFSASAFHWLPKKSAYEQARRLLKPGGTLALFWNRPFVGREDDPLHQEIRAIYLSRLPGNCPDPEVYPQRYERKLNALRRRGFRQVVCRLYHAARAINADDYIRLLNTYPDHITLSQEVKAPLEQDIHAAITAVGSLMVYDTVDLYLGRKP